MIWEKKGSQIFFGAIGVPKMSYKISKTIEKTPYKRVTQKRCNFAPGAANHTFFTHPVFQEHHIWLKTN